MNERDPFNASGDPGHPGVQGKPFDPNTGVRAQSSPPVEPGQEVDSTGTGTFPPSEQGNVGRAQPAGLSGTTEYGVGTVDSASGGHGVASPKTHPEPNGDEEEDEDVPFDQMNKEG